MKERNIKNLLQEYFEGDTSLDQEQSLFGLLQDTDSSVNAWATFVKKNKIEPSEDFNDTLWKSFQHEKKRTQNLRIFIMSVAASALLFVSFFAVNWGQQELSYAEKEALLNQALNMFPESDPDDIDRNIIYENEMIIVYTSNE